MVLQISSMGEIMISLKKQLSFIRSMKQEDYTIGSNFYEFKLPLNVEYIIHKNDSVRLHCFCHKEKDCV